MHISPVLCVLRPTQLQVTVDQKHLAEARSGILSILHTIMSSVTLLWSTLYVADSSERPTGATCSSNINLGSTKVRKHTWKIHKPSTTTT